MLQNGTTLHHYRVISSKGNGTYGYVFEVEDTQNGGKVALKILSNKVNDNEVRFRAENGHLHTLISSDFVITPTTRVLDIGGETFYCMELADTSTDKYLSSNQLTNEEASKLFLDICEGLKYAHDNGIVHRDLHPGNVLLMIDALNKLSPRLTDFGMAKDFNDTSLSSMPLGIWGAVGFRSPEIFFMAWDEAEIDKYVMADVYALGIVMHILFATRPVPYITGLVDSISDYLWRQNVSQSPNTFQIDPRTDPVLKEQYYQDWLTQYGYSNQDKLRVILRDPDPALEADVNRIIQKCCAPDYNNRYENVGTLMEDIRNIC